MNDTLLKIAQQELAIDTREEQMSDRLDFHDLSVWSIKKALERAYQAGMEAEAEKVIHNEK